jgi:hypothetical protein
MVPGPGDAVLVSNPDHERVDQRRWSDLEIVHSVSVPPPEFADGSMLTSLAASTWCRRVLACHYYDGSLLYLIDWETRPSVAHPIVDQDFDPGDDYADDPDSAYMDSLCAFDSCVTDLAITQDGRTFVVAVVGDAISTVNAYQIADDGSVRSGSGLRFRRDRIANAYKHVADAAIRCKIRPGGRHLAVLTTLECEEWRTPGPDREALRGEVILYDRTTGEPLWCRPIDRSVTGDARPGADVDYTALYDALPCYSDLDFTPDGQHLVVGSNSGQIVVLDASDGRRVQLVSSQHPAGPTALAVFRRGDGV